jgi:hypothetical protein
MSDFNTRGKLPFTVVSSSVNTGYAAELTASVGYNIDIVNKHKDEYGQTKDAPAQGPFTSQHVGGNQHRHAPLNAGNDDTTNRPEAYIISSSAGSVKVYGPDINGLDKPRSLLTRDNTAKSPVNIKNIQTSGNVAGNFEYNYQVVQSVGRRTTNNLINDGFEASGSLTTKFVSGSHEIYTLPNIINNSKSIFVERFNSPGGKEESSRGALDREGEEFSPNNSLTTRNIKVRQPYYNQLTQHTAQFNSGSTNKLLPDVGTTDAVTIHGVNRNTIEKVLTFPEIMSQKSILSGSLATQTSDNFGYSVAINAIGNRMVVGAWQDERSGGQISEGLAYVFVSGTSGWTQQHILSGTLAVDIGDRFGSSVSINAEGDRIIIGSPSDQRSGGSSTEGLAYVFVSGTSGWTQQHILSGTLAVDIGDNFGKSVAINSAGNIAVVGAPLDERSGGSSAEGLAYVFVSGTSGWTQQHILSGSFATHSSDRFGDSVSINSPGDRVIVGAPFDERNTQPSTYNEGLAYIFVSGTNGWDQKQILSGSLATNTSDLFGWSVSMNSSGDRVVVGATADERSGGSLSEGLAYVFVSGASGWSEQHILSGSLATDPSDTFGLSVSINSLGDRIVVGAVADERSGGSSSEGVAYVFVSGASGWSQQYILSGSFANNSTDNFGNSVAINSSGDRIIIGAPNDENLTGNTETGLVYTFDAEAPTEDLTTHDNFWVQHAIPSTDLRYKWIAESVSSDQQPIQYQSYALPYSTGSLYNSNGAYTDISFEQTGPFGDHLGISGAIDKDEMFTSNYTNTMYRDRKYLRFATNNPQNFQIDFSNLSQELSQKSFTFSFWFRAGAPTDLAQWDILYFSGSLGKNTFTYESDRIPNSYLLFQSSLLPSLIDTGVWSSPYEIYEEIDNKWSHIVITKDIDTLITRGEIISVYLNGGLVYKQEKSNYNFTINEIRFLGGKRPSVPDALEESFVDEFAIWNSSLSEKQILDIFRKTKTKYNEYPKKYFEHKYDISGIPPPSHAYSSRIDDQRKIIFDEIDDKHASLINFTSSVNIRPQNSGIISYSTYFNGPYEGASWKSIRNAEHPVTRKLTTENTNIVSVLITEGPRTVKRNVNGIPVTFQLPGSRKQGQLLNVKESPVYINNKPLKHRFILKDSQDQNIAIETTHTYGNNLQYFANQQLNDTLGLLKTDRQMYNVLYDHYSGETEETENPIQKLVGYTYSETIFPKPGTGLLRENRQRTDYITDQPGYSIDGYDRQLGTQRVFWRDSQEDRMRTRRNYITSLGDQVESEYDLPFQTPSVAALEYISEGSAIEHYSTNPIINFFGFTATRTGSFIDISYKKSSELNSSLYYINVNWGSVVFGTAYVNAFLPSFSIPEIYFFADSSLTNRDQFNVVITSSMYPLQSTSDPSSLRFSPKMIFEHCSYVASPLTSPEIETNLYNFFTHDLGLNRFTEKISGKNPSYDSYEDYYVDIKTLSNDNLISYSRIPEFKISDQVSQLIAEYGGDSTKITLEEYLDDFEFSYKKLLDVDNREIVEEDTINIIVDGVKKLLPYNGFYPQDRSLQLVNYLKKSYLDTNAIGGGLYLTSSFYATEKISRQDKLAQFMKESAFLEPLYSPGIFYNLIKSGIAVDWSVYTGSLPISNDLIPLSEKPQFKITFESLLNLQNIPLSSSSDNAENRIMKYKEIDTVWDSQDYPGTNASSFQAFFEKLGDGSPLYTLSINNFLAETINFFLKDSTLNTFISKADSDFLSFDASKTYYMDVVLRKNDIVMCEAHSSSLADSFGKMSGRYFGPSFWSGSAADKTRIENNRVLAETLRDPGYCAYTPPYYYGDSIARISFKPSLTRKYTLDEIFEEMEIQFINTGFMNDSVYTSGSLYSSFTMPLESSVTIKGQIENREQTVQLENRSQNFSNAVARNLTNLVGTATNSTGVKKWVISPKMEVPVLDFSNQEFVTSTTILTQSRADLELKTFIPTHTPPTASGFGRGMWSGYGEIPTGDKGIFLELRETYPRQLVRVLDPTTRQFVETNTGSLLQACGFQAANDKLSKKIGEIADSRDISEAIIIIPYLDKASTGKVIRFGGGFSTLTVNDTVEIEGKNFIKINQNIFNYQKTNVLANKPAVSLADFSRGVGNIQETSISRMIGLMNKYVLPPNFDFLLNDSVTPFVMYIAEFTSKLDKQDLADIWQGVMPKIAMRAEREKTVISHKNTQFDFFHGQGLPEDVKFMIFKAKKRAEINYYKMTADSSDDGLFPSIQAGKPPSPYSFNWPYDYCSLVETARVDVEIEYINKSGSNNT